MRKFWYALWLVALALVLYVGLFLLGWGLGDIPGFFADPARAAYVLFMFLMALAAPFIARLVPEGISDKVARKNTRRGRTLPGILPARFWSSSSWPCHFVTGATS